MLDTMGKSVGKFFTDMASDAFKLSDLCQVVKPCDFDKTLSDDFVLTEDDEQIYFLLKSRTDEYCFTNRALLILDSDKATDGGRKIVRYEYSNSILEDVRLQTASRIDFTAELLFNLNKQEYIISVERNYTEQLIDIYKILTEIELLQVRANESFNLCEKSVKYATSAIGKLAQTNNMLDLYTSIVEFNESYLTDRYEDSFGFDMSDLFEKYISE